MYVCICMYVCTSLCLLNTDNINAIKTLKFIYIYVCMYVCMYVFTIYLYVYVGWPLGSTAYDLRPRDAEQEVRLRLHASSMELEP
jgi:hypothetical protein